MPFSLSYYLKYNRNNPSVEAPLYLRIIYNRKYYFKSMRRVIPVEKWDERKERIKNHDNSIKLNLYLDKVKRKVENKMLELDEEYEIVPPQLIKKALQNNHKDESFISFFKGHLNYLEAINKIGTFKKDRSVLRKLNNYLKGRDFQFIEISEEFLESFEVFLKKKYGNGQHSVHNNIRVLRKLFYQGIRRGYKVKSPDVFRNYPLKKGRAKEIVFLTEDEVNSIWELDIKNNPILETCRDMFVFACDVGGMRISDVLLLKWSNIENGRVTFNSRKTDITVSIKLNTRPNEIISRYKSESQKRNSYIFPLLKGLNENDPKQKYSMLNSKTAIVNKNLKMIAVLSGIKKRISFHVSRHTFGMRAIQKGIQLKYVSELMGHSNILMTEKYLDIQSVELDKAMEKFDG